MFPFFTAATIAYLGIQARNKSSNPSSNLLHACKAPTLPSELRSGAFSLGRSLDFSDPLRLSSYSACIFLKGPIYTSIRTNHCGVVAYFFRKIKKDKRKFTF